MLRRSTQASNEPPQAEVQSLLRSLKAKLKDALEVLGDPALEARVNEYFDANPTFSRDAIHIAAVACRFAKEVKRSRDEGTVQGGASQQP